MSARSAHQCARTRYLRLPRIGWLEFRPETHTGKTTVSESVVNSAETRIWDLPLRLFHWLLVLTLGGSWLTHELGTAWMDWHVRLGYFALGLVVFRILWGFVGPRHARFASFLRSPGAAFAYARAWAAGRPPHVAGHSPMAGYAVLALLLSVALQATSGLFKSDDFLIQGPWHHAAPSWLNDLAATVHGANFNVLLGLVGLHLTVMAIYRWRLERNLVGAMITGRRALPGQEAIASDRLAVALAAALAAAGIVWIIVSSAPQPDPSELFF
jgi:cytochrome b